MDEQLTISTPEQVAFHYEMAGIGSRSLAALLDHLILGIAIFLMYCALSLLLPVLAVSGGSGESSGMLGVYILLAVIVLVQFLLLWGYFVIFEIVWRGATPGKRAAKLRVLRRDGQPIGAGEAMIRNLVRLIDFLPFFYGVGLITMFIDKDARRLGDLAAGTIVVKETDQVALKDVRVPAQPAPNYNDPQSIYAQPSYPSQRTNPPAPQYSDPLPGISLYNVTTDDYRLILELVQRVARGELQRERAYDLLFRLAYGVASRMGFDFREWQDQGWEPMAFLQSVLYSYDLRGR